MGVADLREMLYYLRPTDDGRIAIGGGAMGIAFGDRIGGRRSRPRGSREAAARGLVWLFPQLEGVRFDAAWSGPMDLTNPALPFFESAPGGTVHAGLGFSGHGLTSTRLGGKILASLTLGADDRWSRMPVVGPPLAHARRRSRCAGRSSVGGLGLRGHDGAHAAGRRPGLLPRAIIAWYGKYTAMNSATGRRRPRRRAVAGPFAPRGEADGRIAILIQWVS